MKIFKPEDVVNSPDELLKVTKNPRHRAMIKNYRRHAMLEIAGRWPEIMGPGMLVESPSYRVYEGGNQILLNGREEITGFYKAFTESGANVFGPIEEKMAVADWGLALESFFGNHLRGHQLAAMGHDIDDLEGHYQLTHWISSFWPYDENCLLIGEHIYENAAGCEVQAIDADSFVTPEKAAAVLNPMLDGPEPEWMR